jgi:hypothetical protein
MSSIRIDLKILAQSHGIIDGLVNVARGHGIPDPVKLA